MGTLLGLRRALALLVTIELGLASRLLPVGIRLWDKSLGDVLYAVAVYLVLALGFPRLRPVALAGLAFLFCLGIELLQLTGIPARYGSFPPVRCLLGSRFAWEDILCYVIGVALIAGLDALAFRARKSDKHSDAT